MATVLTRALKGAVQVMLALAMTCAPGWGQAQMLASIPVELAPQREGSPSAAPAGLRVRVHALDASGLAKLFGQPEGAGDVPSVDLTLAPGTHPELDAPVDALAASFLVDFDDPAVVRLSKQLRGEPGGVPLGGAQLVEFVAKSMRSELSGHVGLASQAARSLRGDCTEHAVLLAALARSMQIPARVVSGAALLYVDGRWQAYGHAWAQTREGGRWIVRDSALAGAPGPVYYLPATLITNEGPGYILGWGQSLRRMPSRIEILGPGDPPPALLSAPPSAR